MTDRTQGDGGATPPTGAKGPDELRQQIEQTRSQLGDTVEELAAKADVKGRAKARAADLMDKAGALTVQLRSSAAHAGHRVQEKATHAGHRTQEGAGRSGHVLQERATRAGHLVQERATRAGHTVQERASRVGQSAPVSNAVEAYRRNPRPMVMALAAGAAALVATGLLIRRSRRR
ncbi:MULTISPECIES: DUF3618 domain-containing protein [unclassified Streptomyces]|uniref:DUF3618 domain-containing protein n=1 Tax=unclassified Streptomyces TaxID=2593676 RepID=UPI0033E7BEA9